MDFERQKPITDEYRENWSRTFAQRIRDNAPTHSIYENRDGSVTAYPNGCPILSEEQGK